MRVLAAGLVVLVVAPLLAPGALAAPALREAEDFAVKTAGGKGTSSSASGGAYWNLWSNGHIEDTLEGDGASALSVVARGRVAKGVWPAMVVSVDGSPVATFAVGSTGFAEYLAPALPPGAHVVRVAFTNDLRTKTEDRNLHVDLVRVQGSPPGPPPPPPPPPPPAPLAYEAREAEAFAVKTAGGASSSTLASGGAYWNLWSNGHLEDTLVGDGAAPLRIVARGRSALGVWPAMVVSVDGAPHAAFDVANLTFQEYVAPPLAPGSHVVRIAFTNDVRTKTEDRNLHVDVVRGGAGPASPVVVPEGATLDVPFAWPGGPGFLVAHAATLPSPNPRPSLRLALDGAWLGERGVAGPVPRPWQVPFDAGPGNHTATFEALHGPVEVALEPPRAAPLPPDATGAGARVRHGGAAQGSAWNLTDYGWLEMPLVVPSDGWYALRVEGHAGPSPHGTLVHLWRNRTVVAEALFPGPVDLQARAFLHAGLGYTLGASFENPAPGRWLRVDRLSAEPSAAPAMLPPVSLPGLVAPPDGWPQYGFDGWNTRHNPDPSLPDAGEAANLTLRWRTQLDGSVTSTPAVTGGRVYAGTWNASVYALDAATGAVAWRADLPERVDDSPSVAGGLVLVGSGHRLVALHEGDGSLAWMQEFSGHFWSSPIVESGEVFVGIDADRGYVGKLDLATGALHWLVATSPTPGTGARVWASPLVPPGAGLVVVGTSPGTASGQPPTSDALLAYDRATGDLVWQHQLFPGDTNDDSSAEASLRENRDLSGTPHLALLGGEPVVLASQKHGPAWAVRLADGSLVHGSRQLTPRPVQIGSGGTAHGIEVVTASGTANRVAAFDLATGDLLWEQAMPSTTFVPVALGGGLAWAGSWAGRLHAFDLATGREVVQLPAGGGVLGGASLAHGMVVVGSAEKVPGSHWNSLGKLPGYVEAWALP